MTTITERMGFATDAAHDFADAAMVQLFQLADIPEGVSDNAAAKQHPELLAALIEAAAKVYVVERQCDLLGRVADELQGVAAEIRAARDSL